MSKFNAELRFLDHNFCYGRPLWLRAPGAKKNLAKPLFDPSRKSEIRNNMYAAG